MGARTGGIVVLACALVGCAGIPSSRIPDTSSQIKSLTSQSRTLASSIVAAEGIQDAYRVQIGKLEKDIDYPGLTTLLMGIGAAGAAAASLHQDALIGFAFGAGIPAAFSRRYNPAQQRTVLDKASVALDCVIRKGADYSSQYASELGDTVSLRGLALEFRENLELASAFVEAANSNLHFSQSVLRIDRITRGKLISVIEATSFETIRDDFAKRVVDARKKGDSAAQEIQKIGSGLESRIGNSNYLSGTNWAKRDKSAQNALRMKLFVHDSATFQSELELCEKNAGV